MPSVLLQCWLDVRKSMHLVNKQSQLWCGLTAVSNNNVLQNVQLTTGWE